MGAPLWNGRAPSQTVMALHGPGTVAEERKGKMSVALVPDKSVTVSIPEMFNITSYFIDRNLELGRGRNTAIYEHGRTLNYEQLSEMVNRAGSGLRSLGLDRENRVVLAMPDSAEFVAAFFGAAKIGAIPIPVNPTAKPDEILYFLRDSGARRLLFRRTSGRRSRSFFRPPRTCAMFCCCRRFPPSGSWQRHPARGRVTACIRSLRCWRPLHRNWMPNPPAKESR